MKVKLEREDWAEALEGAISLLKNALAQVEVYKIQVELAEKKLAEFPPTPAVSAPDKTPKGTD